MSKEMLKNLIELVFWLPERVRKQDSKKIREASA